MRRLRVQHHAPIGLDASRAATSSCSMSSSSIRRPPISISTCATWLASPCPGAADPHARTLVPAIFSARSTASRTA
jgi:hypothetical protein